MPRQVNIPGVGAVNFPDTMSDTDVTSAAKQLYEQHSQPAPLNSFSNPEDEPAAQAFAFNKGWAKQGPYTTKLLPKEEAAFQQWTKQNNVPWQDSPTADYDMRGYWKALQSGKAKQELNAWDGKMHFPDTWKTPYNGTFSNESMYASEKAPRWQGNKLVTPDGRLVTDETPQAQTPPSANAASEAMGTGSNILSAFIQKHPFLQKLLPNWEQEKAQLTAEEQRQGQLAGQADPYTLKRWGHYALGLAAGEERDIPEDARMLSTAAFSTLFGGIGGATGAVSAAYPELGQMIAPYLAGANIGVGSLFGGQAVKHLIDTRKESGLAANLERANDVIQAGMGVAGAVGSGREINAIRDMNARARVTAQPEAPPAATTTQAAPPPAPAENMLSMKAKLQEPHLEPTPEEITQQHKTMLEMHPSDSFAKLPKEQQLEYARQDLKKQEGQVALMALHQAESGYGDMANQILANANPRVRAWYADLGGKYEEPKTDLTQAAPQSGQGSAVNAQTYADTVGGWMQRAVRDAAGQDALNDMTANGEQVSDVSKKFWNDTYWKLPAEVQQHFQKYVKSLWGGTEPGGVIASGPSGDVRAKDWQDLAEHLDLSNEPENLEGPERGYVVLMREANKRFGSTQGGGGSAKTMLPISGGAQTPEEEGKSDLPQPRKKAFDPALTQHEDALRETATRLASLSTAMKGETPDVRKETIRDITGKAIPTLIKQHLTEEEAKEYNDLTERPGVRKARGLTPGEQAALDAVQEKQIDTHAAVKQYIEDNELGKEVTKNILNRFYQAVPEARGKSLEPFRAQFRQFLTPNVRQAAERDVADAAGFSTETGTAPEDVARELHTEEIGGTVAASAAGAGRSEEARQRLNFLRSKMLQGEQMIQRNLARQQMVEWVNRIRTGAPTTFTNDELRQFPEGMRRTIRKELREQESLRAKTAQEGARPVVPQPAEAAPAPEKTAAGVTPGPQEGVDVSKPEEPDEIAQEAERKRDAALAEQLRGMGYTNEEEIAQMIATHKQKLASGTQSYFRHPQAQTPPQPAQPAAAPPAGGAGVPPTPPPTGAAAGAPPPPPPQRPRVTLQDLTKQLEQYPNDKYSWGQRLRAAMGKTKAEYSALGGKATQAYDRLKWASANAWMWFRHPQAWTDFHDAVGKYSGATNVISDAIHKFVSTGVVKVRDPITREAFTNFVQADGDMNVLAQRAAATTDERLKAGYERAMNLSAQQKDILTKIRTFMDSEFDEAVKAGILKHGIANYVMQVWNRPNAYTDRLMANLNFGELQTNPRFMRQRIFDSYFEGEQAGFAPKNKDLLYLVAAHHQAFGRAVAARAFIRSVSDGNAEIDGRPLVTISGIGQPVEDPVTNEIKNYLIKPNATPKDKIPIAKAWFNPKLMNSGKVSISPDGKFAQVDVHDYRVIDHPALRGWKWVAPGADGAEVLLQGDLRVHPEIYTKLSNILGRSKVPDVWLGKVALGASGFAKHTLLTLSAFHQTQETVHALGHGVNPLKLKPLDLADPTQRSLVDHGLMVADFGAEASFSEGVGNEGLLKYVPVAGPTMHAYQDYLFRDYIPRLKMDMAMQAFKRNTARYAGKMSSDQIAALTARQANAAFGGLNYKLMGRNPTMQDIFRLTVLAPDFLEARARFAGQAFSLTGKEQFNALLKIAAVQYIGARIVNSILNNGDPKMDPYDAFSIIHGDKRMQIRSVPGDMLNAMMDTRRFIQHRANPLMVRPLIEWYTGRDEFGRQRTGGQEMADWVKNSVPIPFQGPIKKGDQTLADTMLSSVGIETTQNHTRAERLALAYLGTHQNSGVEDDATLAQSRLVNTLRKGLRNGSVSQDQVFNLYNTGKLSETKMDYLLNTANTPDLVRWSKGLKLNEAMDVYDHASNEEREQLHDMLVQKVASNKSVDLVTREKYFHKLGM